MLKAVKLHNYPFAYFLSLCCRKERNKENGTFANCSARKSSSAACYCGWLYRSSQAQPTLPIEYFKELHNEYVPILDCFVPRNDLPLFLLSEYLELSH